MARPTKPILAPPDNLLRLMEYAKTESEFDPPEVQANKKQLHETLSRLGTAITQGESFTLDFTGTITVTVDVEGQLRIKMADPEDMLIGQIAEAVIGLNHHASSSFKQCEEEECKAIYFSDSQVHRRYCGMQCTKKAAYKGLKARKRAAREQGVGVEEEGGSEE